MRTTHYALPVDPRLFGRKAIPAALAAPLPASGISDDLRLFAVTFAAGFLFVSILLA